MGRVFISIVVAFIVVGGLLVYQATRGTSSLVLLPSELIQKAHGAALSRIRVSGRVVEPIAYQIEPSFKLSFLIEDRLNAGKPIPVVYEGVRPDMFSAGRDVLIDGDFDGETLRAAAVLTQCPSKYEPVGAPPGMGQTPPK